MKRLLKKLLIRLAFPPLWLLILLIPVVTVLLVITLGTDYFAGLIRYGVYLLSAYALVVLVLDLVLVVPGKYRLVKNKLYQTSVGSKLLGDPVYRVQVMLYASLGVNLLYIATNLISGYLYDSNWFVTLALYYFLLSLMRFLLLRQINNKQKNYNVIVDYKWLRWCGIILLIITAALTIVMTMMIYDDEGYEYSGILIYAMAAYTFYIFTLAIVNLVRFRKYHSPVLAAVKTVNFVAALVSMLALETAMLSQFGTENQYPYFDQIMIGTSGTVICLVIGIMAIKMIVTSTKEIKMQYKHEIY